MTDSLNISNTTNKYNATVDWYPGMNFLFVKIDNISMTVQIENGDIEDAYECGIAYYEANRRDPEMPDLVTQPYLSQHSSTPACRRVLCWHRGPPTVNGAP